MQIDAGNTFRLHAILALRGTWVGRGKSVMLAGTSERCRAMPACLIEDEDGMGARRDVDSDLFEMHAPFPLFGPRCCSGA